MIILLFSLPKRVSRSRFCALPELSRMMTSIFGLAQEHAWAILEQASRPGRFVAIKIESCTAPAAS